MAVTRSTSVERAQNPRQRIEAGGRALERVLLLLTSALILAAVMPHGGSEDGPNWRLG